MKKRSSLVIIATVIVAGSLPFIILGMLGINYWRFGHVTKVACGQEMWWEDQAECAAQFALEKNDPRYCRIDLFGEIGDLCNLLYSQQTKDVATCSKIDLLEAKEKCRQRLQNK